MKLARRMLCPDCEQVREVMAVANGQVTLVCSHVRQFKLPLKPHRVSVENLNKKIGWELFPVDRIVAISSSLSGLER